MKSPLLLCGFLYLLLSLPFILKSQSRCADDERRRGSQEKKFEQWMAQKKRENTSKKNANDFFQTQGTSIIPVVVHVIHNGEKVGQGANISDEQIASQIKVLNDDFRRMNADRVNTPPEFADVAGSFDIQFVLAKRAPGNCPATGIVRVNGGQDNWSISEISRMKALSYWPAEKYLNIWVASIGPILGYAQFPDYDIPGLGNNELDSNDYLSLKNRETDGLIIDYSVVGSILDNPKFNLTKAKYNLGRTATHEMGHFFGLRHVWGDKKDCSGTDYVEDTPKQSTNYMGKCPSEDDITVKESSCGTNAMYQNYLNYTNDKCMNLFTQGQVERMAIVLQNSPRRKDLLTSQGATPPSGNSPSYDIQLVEAGPITVTSNPKYVPTITLRNKSGVDLLEFNSQVTTTFNGASVIKNFNAPAPINQLLKLKLDAHRLTDGENSISINVRPLGCQVDTHPLDNTLSYSVILDKSKNSIPLRENFKTSPTWRSVGTTNFNWTITPAGTNGAEASFFVSPNQKAFLLSPVMDFSDLQKASIFFNVSYGYAATSLDTLKLLVSKNGGASYEPTPLYVKTASALATATLNADKTPWQPTISSDWRREFVSLTDLTNKEGKDSLRFAFYATGNGNNIFINNIELYADDNPNPLNIAAWYSVYGFPNEYHITFNLEKRQDITIELYAVTGQQVMQEKIPDVLNQTFSFTTDYIHPGIYILRLLGKETAATRLLVK